MGNESNLDGAIMEIYHGSNVTVSHPIILTNGFYKDFGYGFYCTKIIRQAEKWAFSRPGQSIVNRYEYTPDSSLRMVLYETMTESWLDMIANCRRGIEHNYDIVEGPMADDTIWDYVEDYAMGKISRAAFWELAKFKYPTHQITFCTQRSLHTIAFLGSHAL